MRRTFLFALVALMLVSLLPENTWAASCTRVAGGSPTTDWYWDGGFEELVANAEWERQTRGGQSIDRWALGGTGWATRIRSACSPATPPTRFILHVLPDRTMALEALLPLVEVAVAAIPVNVPSATRITLLPSIGGDCPSVPMSLMQAIVVEAINQFVGGIVDAGPEVSVADCAMYSDTRGHLTQDGAEYVAQQYAALL